MPPAYKTNKHRGYPTSKQRERPNGTGNHGRTMAWALGRFPLKSVERACRSGMPTPSTTRTAASGSGVGPKAGGWLSGSRADDRGWGLTDAALLRATKEESSW